MLVYVFRNSMIVEHGKSALDKDELHNVIEKQSCLRDVDDWCKVQG